MSQSILARMSGSRVLRKLVGRPYLLTTVWIWKHLPAGSASWRLVQAYGFHLSNLTQLRVTKKQSVGTFFFRNRPELELLMRLLGQKQKGSPVDIAVLGCSKGAEVYSISYAVRRARPDLQFDLRALDISKEVIELARQGTYSITSGDIAGVDDSSRDQTGSIFERISPEEMEAMFDSHADEMKVKPQFCEGITWHVGDAGDPRLKDSWGLQDIVVANRFLCHMEPVQAERCLRSLARLVKPGGYLFVSGVDLDVRTRVARDLGWLPVTDLLKEIHEGDPSLRQGWPLEYWGLEPFNERLMDSTMRYASVFQIVKTQTDSNDPKCLCASV